MKAYYQADGGDYRAIFSRFDLDSDDVVDVQPAVLQRPERVADIDDRRGSASR